MNYRRLGKTGLMVSEVGLGGEWLERHNTEECKQIIDHCAQAGINILDCWMSEPNVRSNIGKAIAGSRDKWYIQGHIGSTWQNGQYVRTRDIDKVKEAFEDLLTRMGTDYIDLGMIHYIDEEKEWQKIQNSEFLDYVFSLKEKGIIKHIGMSTHNPLIAKKAVESGFIEMIMFSINPAFDVQPPTEDLDNCFAETLDSSWTNIAPERAELYQLCEQNDVGITVMKPFAGGRLLDEKRSPFGKALTPVQCIHYALTRPAVASVLVGYDSVAHVDEAVHYEVASEAEKNYGSVLAHAPRNAYYGQCTYCGHCKPCPVNIDIALVNKFYDLATMQPTVPASVQAHYEAMDQLAGACIGCHACERRCPFGVPIAAKMLKAKELFGK